MIIDQPCVSCGITLEKGVKTVAVFDIIKGCLGIIISSILMVHYKPEPGSADVSGEYETDVRIEKIKMVYYDGFWISLTFLLLSIFEIFLAIILYYSAIKKSVPFLHFWLIVTGFLMPVNMFLIKIYEMIVVFAYTEDLTCEAGGKALEEFRKLPYVCDIKTQFYPKPVYGQRKNHRNASSVSTVNARMDKRSTYLTEKSILMNVDTSVFSMVQHQSYV